MRTRGKKSNCTSCRVIENAPEMSACDAMTVDAVANATTGSSNTFGTSP